MLMFSTRISILSVKLSGAGDGAGEEVGAGEGRGRASECSAHAGGPALSGQPGTSLQVKS